MASREKKSCKEMASAARLVTETVKRTAELDKQEDEVGACTWLEFAGKVFLACKLTYSYTTVAACPCTPTCLLNPWSIVFLKFKKLVFWPQLKERQAALAQQVADSATQIKAAAAQQVGSCPCIRAVLWLGFPLFCLREHKHTKSCADII